MCLFGISFPKLSLPPESEFPEVFPEVFPVFSSLDVSSELDCSFGVSFWFVPPLEFPGLLFSPESEELGLGLSFVIFSELEC